MRIAIWAPVLYPWMIELGKVFSDRDHAIILFSNGIFGNYPGWKKFEKDVCLIPKVQLSGELFPHPSLIRAIQKVRPDMLIVLATETFASMTLILFARFLDIRTVLIVENNIERNYDQLLRKIAGRFKRILVRYVHKSAKVLIAESDATYKYLLRMGCDSERIHILLHGTNIELFKPEEVDVDFLNKNNIPVNSLNRLKVLYLGGFNDHKGIEYLVEAIQDGALDDVLFIIPVFGPLIAGYISLLENKKNVFLLPQVGYDEMTKLFNLSDVLIVPSLSNSEEGSERSPNVVIEALACGKPVIGTDVGGVPIYVGDAGLIIPERDSQAITSAFAKLTSDENLMLEIKSKARLRAENVFDIRKYADELLNISSEIRGVHKNEDSPS